MHKVAPFPHINRVIQLWKEGKPAIGFGVPDLSFDQAVYLSRSDYDFLFCDMEHRPLNLAEMRNFLQALMDKQRLHEQANLQMRPTPFLRIPAYGREKNHWLIKQALDLGIPGIILPTVSSTEEAEWAAAGCRYMQAKDSPLLLPLGMRGAAPAMAARYWGVSTKEYVAMADLWPLNPNGELLLVVQIEDREGLKHLGGILKVKGIGMVLIGPQDLSFALGYPSNPEHPEVESTIQEILAETKKAGVSCGIVAPPARLIERVRQGFSWVSTGDVDSQTLRRAHETVAD